MERMGDILARNARRGTGAARRGRPSAGQPRLAGQAGAQSQPGKSPQSTQQAAQAAQTTPAPLPAAPRRTPRLTPGLGAGMAGMAGAVRAPITGPLARRTPRPASPLAPATSMTSAPDVAQRSIPAADTLDSATDGVADGALDSERILELPSPRARVTAPLAATASALSAMAPRSSGEPPVRREPLRRAAPSAQQRSRSGGMSAGSSGMLSLAEAAQGYARALRPNRAASGSANAANSANAATSSGGAPARKSRRADDDDGVCPHCHGAGYVRLDVPVGDPSFGQAVACVCKERQMEDRRMSDLRRMSSLDAFRDKTFATFESALPGLREALEVAQHYAEDPQGWLVLSGGYGVGKTHLAAAIAHERLASGQSVFFSIVPDLLDHLRAAFAPSSEMPYDELFDKVREAGLLVLDDLGAENATAWATEKLFQIINYRYNYHMPTVVTTNHRLLAHMDERIRSRLSDRSFVRNVAIDSTDYRERRAGRARPASQSGNAGAARTTGATGAARGSRSAYQR